jgi:hypothetical protein
MAKSHLKLVAPGIANRTVTPKRRPNADLRRRESVLSRNVSRRLFDLSASRNCRPAFSDLAPATIICSHEFHKQIFGRCEAAHTRPSQFALVGSLQELPGFQPNRRFRMKLLIIVFFFTAVGLLAAVTGIQRSHSISAIGRAGTDWASTLQEMQSGRSADKLPIEDFDDRSLVFPRETKR